MQFQEHNSDAPRILAALPTSFAAQVNLKRRMGSYYKLPMNAAADKMMWFPPG